MKKIIFYFKNIIIVISQFVVFLTCILALGIGLKELIKEDVWGAGFIIACIIFIASWSYSKEYIWRK